MRNPISLAIIALVIWIGGSSFVYVCMIRDHCVQTSVVEETFPQVTGPGQTEPIPEPAADPDTVRVPEPAPDPVADAKIFLEEKGPQFIYFEFADSQAHIPDKFSEYVDQLRTYLEGTPKSKVYVTGHTDPIGTGEANDRLSRQRASFVSSYLVQNGIDRSAIVEEGKGSREPVASNDTEEGRSDNRRVEIKIIK